MHERTAYAPFIALISLNLMACADPESTAAEGEPAITSVSSEDSFIETREPARYTNAFLASPDDAKLASSIVEYDDDTFSTVLLEECKARFACTRGGELVLQREGPSCLLGDVVLTADWSARYRESSPMPARGSWRPEVKGITLSFPDALVIHCERID